MSDPAARLGPVVRLAPAKLNLTLAVLGRRPDGFHTLHSVMAPLGLADRLSLAVAPGRDTDSLRVEGFDLGSGPDNLVLRAIGAAREAARRVWPGAPATPPALAARLEKRIPIAAGLAGGSSDAASAIDGALEAWGAELAAVERATLAARLGSDVPFFLTGALALVEGRGERVTPVRGVLGEAPGVLLVTPPFAVPTAAAFGAFASGARPAVAGATRATSEHIAIELAAGLPAAGLVARAGVLAVANDLLVAAEAVAPGLLTFRRSLSRLVRRPIGQSGSGPTCWALYPSLGEAEAAAEAVREATASGALTIPGDGPPFVAATTILSSMAGATPDTRRSEP